MRVIQLLTNLVILLSFSFVARAAEPTFAAMLTVFYHKEDLNFSDLADLRQRIRRASALPAISVGYDHQMRNTESFSITDNISVSGGRVTIGPEDNDLDLWNNLGRTFRVRAMWRLDELVFNRGELDVLRLRRELIKLRQYYAQQLYKIYETRQLCRARFWQKPDGKRARMYRTQFNSLTDQLDALTGLQFHQQWRKL